MRTHTLITADNTRRQLLQYSHCASDLSGRSIEASASYQPTWTESFISTNTARQLTQHNFTPPLNLCVCVCVCHGVIFQCVSKCVCRDEVILPTFTYMWGKKESLAGDHYSIN